ncbi:hypothetical protein Pelo_2185 [Pelomyxa schiedti]|nr:hypothetical protein Pelo_2185 [Pelomyxa schiedti]
MTDEGPEKTTTASSTNANVESNDGGGSVDPVATSASPSSSATGASAAAIASPKLFFEGTVTDSIREARARDFMIVVFVTDPSYPDCLKMETETFSAAHVCDTLKETAIALKLLWNSEDGKVFASTFPVLTVPTVFFINSATLAAVKILVGFVAADDLVEATCEAVSLCAVPATRSPQPANAPLPPQPTPLPKPAPSPNSVTTVSGPSAGVSPALTPDKVAQEKARLLQKLEELKKANAQKAAADALEAEKKRRESGKSLQDSIRTREELLAKKAAEEAQREKEETRLAKEKILSQIRKEREERMNLRGSGSSSDPLGTSTSSTSVYTYPENEANIAFKLLSGDVVRHQFSAQDTLATCKLWLDSTQGYQRVTYVMKNAYPRMDFLPEHYDQTLSQLGLAPTATIIIAGEGASAPRPPPSTSYGNSDTVATQPSDGGGGGWFGSIVKGLSSFFWAAPPSPQFTGQAPNPPVETMQAAQQQTTTVTRRAGVHGLDEVRSDNVPPSDKQRFNNGNSTQFE